MTFLAPSLLWFLAAAAVPVIIHLINRRRHKTIEWAAMRFLLRAARESRGKKKLRHILILTCRALGLAALALAAARPIMSGIAGWGGGSPDTVIVVFDRSASMDLRPGDGMEPRRSIALQKIRESLSDLEPSRVVLVDSASGEAQEVPSVESLGELLATGPSDAAADMPALALRSAEVLAETSGRSEVWLASDLQAANWQADDERWAAARSAWAGLPVKPNIRVLGLTGKTAPNAAVRVLSARRAADAVVLELEVQRVSETRGSRSIPLTTQLNGGKTTETLTLDGELLRFQKRLALSDDTEEGYGWVSIPGDGNVRDNVAFFAFGPARPANVLLVSEANESADYLALAAAPPGLGEAVVQRVSSGTWDGAISQETSAVIWAAPLPSRSQSDALEAYLRNGGQVLLLPPSETGNTEFLGHKWEPATEAAAGKFMLLTDWNRSDGPLRDSIDGTPVAGGKLKVIRRQLSANDGTALAKWDDGESALTRKILDRGTLWSFSTLPDYTWSNLGDADVLLPLVQRIIRSGSERRDAAYLADVGSIRTLETVTRLDDAGDAKQTDIAINAGVFRIADRLVAQNRPLAEDLPEQLPRESLDTALQGTGYSLLDQAASGADDKVSRDVWRAFLVAVLLFFIAEAILCLPKKDNTEVLPPRSVSTTPTT